MSVININHWDSELFGLSIASVTSKKLDSAILATVEKEIKQHNIRMLQYLCPCDDLSSIHHAETAGFHFIDIRLTFKTTLSLKNSQPEKKEGINFGLAKAEHIPELLKISAGLYKDTRYYADLNFARDKVSKIYDTWIINAIHGAFDHLCYSLFIANIPIGFCTVRFLDEQTCILGLFGIAQTHQRKSLGSYLLQSVMADLFQRGLREIRVVTQGKNIGAQRTYQGLGFKISCMEMWYHKWR